MSSPGNNVLSCCSRPSTPGSTTRSYCTRVRAAPDDQADRPGALPSIRISRGCTTTASATAGLVIAMRVMSNSVVSTVERPAVSVIVGYCGSRGGRRQRLRERRRRRTGRLLRRTRDRRPAGQHQTGPNTRNAGILQRTSSSTAWRPESSQRLSLRRRWWRRLRRGSHDGPAAARPSSRAAGSAAEQLRHPRAVVSVGALSSGFRSVSMMRPCPTPARASRRPRASAAA